MLHYLQRRAREEPSLSIILLHGFGSNPADMAPLADLFDPQQRYHWFFPEAHLKLEAHLEQEGDMAGTRVWFPDDPYLQQEALAGRFFSKIAAIVPSGLAEAAQQAAAWVKELGLPIEQSILGGNSQGTMVALEMVAEQLASPRGLLLFSSALTASSRWEAGFQRAATCPFLQCHGQVDEVLRYQDAIALHQLLLRSGFQGRLETFEGGHEIPSTLASPVADFLAQLSRSP